MVNGVLQKNEIIHHSQKVVHIESQVLPHIKRMAELCKIKIGIHPGAKAIAHCQIEKDKPLQFFVFANGDCIVNPEIIMKREPFTNKEGCLSLAFRPQKKIRRYKEINISYTSIIDGKVKEYESIIETGERACIFQHEINHFNNVYI